MKFNLNDAGLAGLLFKNAPCRVAFSVFLSLLAGVIQVTLIPLIVAAVRFDVWNPEANDDKVRHVLNSLGVESVREVAIIFFCMCAFVLIARSYSGRLLFEAATQFGLDVKRYLYKKIVKAPVNDVEKLGFASLMATLTEDVDKLTHGVRMMPVVFNYLVIILGVIVVLSFMSIHVTLYVLAAVVIGLLLYKPFAHYGGQSMYRARLCINRILEFNRGLIYGSKELKLNANRRNAYVGELYDVEEEYKKHQLRGGTLFMIGAQYSILMIMMNVGMIAFFVSAYFELSIESTLVIVMTLIYLAEPIMGIAESIASISPAQISKNAIQKALEELGSEESNIDSNLITAKMAIESISAVDLEYKYSNDSDSDFGVGPVSFELIKGQVTFLTGGNGSGKSTLGKIMSLHYLPSAGKLIINGQLVNDQNRESFRQSVSAIYPDYFLFSKLYNVNDETREKLTTYLEKLHLEDKVSINNDELPTSKLSDGQKKRLALLSAFVEDRGVYLFDEWAADQDPQFKNIFYSEILQRLKQDGKIVIVISHDDRYFHLADQLLKMENGKLLPVKNNAEDSRVSKLSGNYAV